MPSDAHALVMPFFQQQQQAHTNMNLPTDLFILQDNAKLVDACRMHNEGVTVRMQQWVGHACSRVLRR